MRALVVAALLVPSLAAASPEQTLADVQASYANVKHGAALATNFTVTEPTPNTLVLVPKQTNAGIKQLTFVIDAKTKRVVKSIVVNSKDDTNTFTFRLGEKEPDAKLFTFSPKRVPHYKVIKI
ncbi:MAG: outer-membrane lipoprotein carrier protein LolA [Deltaproteobacteria bacterium]|nr:outer-membrane lipoprotein carrier protein LolA [Deltaproteobacteria bacterium]